VNYFQQVQQKEKSEQRKQKKFVKKENDIKIIEANEVNYYFVDLFSIRSRSRS